MWTENDEELNKIYAKILRDHNEISNLNIIY